MRTRHTFTATILVALLAIAGLTAAIAADPPPPRIAFVANGRVPADALAAGPTAGQLGAPIYTTEQDSLPPATSNALDAYNPELVIVLGGPVAIADAVVAAISAATGLPVVDSDPAPATGVVRAAGADRFATAAAIADLLGDYNPAALPADAKAVDSDLLDGKDSTAFQPAGSYLTSGGAVDDLSPIVRFTVDGDTTLLSHARRAPLTGPPTVTSGGAGEYRVDLPGIVYAYDTHQALCQVIGTTVVSIAVASTGGDLYLRTRNGVGTLTDGPFTCIVWDT